jgi:hypothetical protein
VLEKLLRGKCIFGERGYGLVIEPDSRPVRPDWLTTLATSVLYPQPAIWLMGSLYRGAVPMTVEDDSYNAQAFHINGNAIYRLSGIERGNEPDNRSSDGVYVDGSSEDAMVSIINPSAADLERPIGSTFAQFYLTKASAWADTTNVPWAYDVFIFQYLFAKENWKVVKNLMHKFQYTDLIVNLYKTEWSVDSVRSDPDLQNALIVHGGYPDKK